MTVHFDTIRFFKYTIATILTISKTVLEIDEVCDLLNAAWIVRLNKVVERPIKFFLYYRSRKCFMLYLNTQYIVQAFGFTVGLRVQILHWSICTYLNVI